MPACSLNAKLAGSDGESDRNALRRETLEVFIWVTAALAWLWIVYLTAVETNRRPIPWTDLVAPSGLAVASLVTWWLSGHKPMLASLLYSVELLALILVQLWLRWYTLVPFLVIPVILVASATCPRRWMVGITAGSLAVLILIALLREGRINATCQMAVAVSCFTALAAWLGTRSLYIALDWAAYSQQQARGAMDALRDRNAELRKLADALADNQERLYHLNIRLEQAKLAAEEAYRTKQLFVANVSHELRTPLNLITGFSEMMAISPESYGGVQLPPEYREDVTEVYRSSKHLLGLVEDVLALAQLEAGQMIIRREWTDLAGVTRDAVETMRPLVEGKGLSVALSVDSALPNVYIDAARMRQVLLNLLSNALRFTAHGAISVGVRRNDGGIIIEVSDTGVGIAPVDLPHIFEDFNCPSKGLAAQRDGFGLGLSISRRLIEAHGGRLWAISEPGRGSQFFVSLPLSSGVDVMAQPILLRTAPRTELEPARPAILAISDDEGDELFDRYLGEYRIVQVKPQEAAAANERYQPVAIWVNDKGLRPQWRRYLAPVLRTSPSLPVVSCHIPSHADIAHKLQADLFLAKPVSSEQIAKAIRRLALEQPIQSILVVSHDPRMLRLLQRVLVSFRELPYRTMQACGAKEGLGLLASGRPDVVLLDLAGADAGAHDVLDTLYRTPEYQHTRVIVIADDELCQAIPPVYRISVHSQKGFSLPQSLTLMKLMIEQLSRRATEA